MKIASMRLAFIALAVALPWTAASAQWTSQSKGPGKGDNPYARELEELRTKYPEKHQVCRREAAAKQLRREERWKFLVECMKR